MIKSKKILLNSFRFKCALFSSSANNSTQRLSPLVKIPNLGAVQGSVTESAWTGRPIYQYLGIHYAESPDGPRRFKKPIPAKPWIGIKDATRYGRLSPFFGNIKRYSKDRLATEKLEDSLSLCVYSNDLKVNKPVIVYIHGGDFFSGGSEQHPPNYLLEKDVVLVVPQYRLGPLGFLSTQSEMIPGNAALFDIMLALKWVQDNIGHFGGDPNNVTLFGQSAGAAMVSAMTISPIVPENLFHKVILQSGASMCSWLYDKTPVENARDIAKITGFNSNAPLEDINKYFMDMDVLTILKAFHTHQLKGLKNGINTTGGNRLCMGGPSGFLPVPPYQLVRSGKIRKNLPMLAGATQQDAMFVLNTFYDTIISKIDLNNKLYDSYKIIDDLMELIGPHEESGGYRAIWTDKMFTHKQLKDGDFYGMIDSLADLATMYSMKAPILRTVQTNAYYNANQTYLYVFEYKGEHTRFGYGADVSRYPYTGGVHHSDDIIYLYPFPPSASNLNHSDTLMAMKMVDLWTSFAISGVPSTPNAPNWPAFTNLTGPYYKIGSELTVGEHYHDEFDRTTKNAREDESKSLRKKDFVYKKPNI